MKTKIKLFKDPYKIGKNISYWLFSFYVLWVAFLITILILTRKSFLIPIIVFFSLTSIICIVLLILLIICYRQQVFFYKKKYKELIILIFCPFLFFKICSKYNIDC